MRKILNKPLFQDDFGNEVYLCQYTDKFVSTSAFIFIGACVPQVNGSYVCAHDAMPAFRESKAIFNESEANCNTCAKLERIPFKKTHPSNQMTGFCKLKKIKISFHPDDHMGMECWETR